MARTYSQDLRQRIIGFIENGNSRRAAARRFLVSESCAIKLYARWRRTGSRAPDRRGGSVGKLAAHKSFLIGKVEARPDITTPELAAELGAHAGMAADPASLSRFLCRHGFTFKKTLMAEECARADVRRKWHEWTRLRLPRLRSPPGSSEPRPHAACR